ncbi:MAG: L-seryl-tRNA(Sec) selenium transferase, partial [Deltaproteobacteria bacterium CG17_big_fil_post_rev_8_21_14_2_50_63_7]
MSSAEDQHRRNAALRELPGVDTASGWPELAGVPPRARLQALRELLDQVRAELLQGSRADCPGRAELVERLLRQFQVLVTPSLRPVINATGVLLHTNLGRAPLPESAIEAVRAAAGNTNLEYDLDLGTRGGRGSGVNQLLCTLSGAPAALVVNNCAAAVLLCISTLAAGKEVIVSRGELVEIGGSFRIPEVVTQGGARLREVGTTNRTHLRDYAAAIGADTAGILKVHASNFQVVGFTHEVSVA